jgi:NifB/MoaA-like Fe-S oxidoreductase
MVILEEIRSQNRATIETVEAGHQESRRDLQDFRTEVRGEFRVVRDVLRAHGEDIGQLKTGLGEVSADLAEVGSELAALKADVSRLPSSPPTTASGSNDWSSG